MKPRHARSHIRRAIDVIVNRRRAHTGKHTALIVAHRLTTAQRCDLIAVIDKGQLAEYGTHEQLLAAGGLYTRLWHDSVGSSVPHRQHDITGKSWKSNCARKTLQNTLKRLFPE